MILAAAAQLGWPYIWGGESRAEGGFDCSGLVDYAYDAAGFTLPGRPTAAVLWYLAKPIKRSSAAPRRPGVPGSADRRAVPRRHVRRPRQGRRRAAPRCAGRAGAAVRHAVGRVRHALEGRPARLEARVRAEGGAPRDSHRAPPQPGGAAARARGRPDRPRAGAADLAAPGQLDDRHAGRAGAADHSRHRPDQRRPGRPRARGAAAAGAPPERPDPRGSTGGLSTSRRSGRGRAARSPRSGRSISPCRYRSRPASRSGRACRRRGSRRP